MSDDIRDAIGVTVVQPNGRSDLFACTAEEGRAVAAAIAEVSRG